MCVRTDGPEAAADCVIKREAKCEQQASCACLYMRGLLQVINLMRTAMNGCTKMGAHSSLMHLLYHRCAESLGDWRVLQDSVDAELDGQEGRLFSDASCLQLLRCALYSL